MGVCVNLCFVSVCIVCLFSVVVLTETDRGLKVMHASSMSSGYDNIHFHPDITHKHTQSHARVHTDTHTHGGCNPSLHTAGPLLTCCFVLNAVIWRVLKVDQVIFGHLPEGLVGHSKACTILIHCHFHSAIVFLFQVVARLSEVRHGHPTRSKCAGAADAVTFTLQLQETLHRLKQQQQRRQKRREKYFSMKN